MKALVAGLALSLVLAAPLGAQTPGLQWQCAPVDAAHPSGGWCPVGATYPLPVVDGASAAAIGKVGPGYTSAQTPITGNATGTTGAVVGTLAGVAAKTTYICSFNVSAIGGTAAVGPITVAGLVTSSQVYQLASLAAGVTLNVPFFPCIPASAVNTPITITTTADGTASAVSVNSAGYQE